MKETTDCFSFPRLKELLYHWTVCVHLYVYGFIVLPVFVVAGLFQSHPPIAFCCWMLTVGVEGGIGELRPVHAHKG